jgi:hypothetical protein
MKTNGSWPRDLKFGKCSTNGNKSSANAANVRTNLDLLKYLNLVSKIWIVICYFNSQIYLPIHFTQLNVDFLYVDLVWPHPDSTVDSTVLGNR